ncbi:hypothetical protein SARC_18035, partial [Sphaeroforma arctica JP610]
MSNFSAYTVHIPPQVYDIDVKVRDAAMAVLSDAAAHMSCLTELIAQRPPLRHMGEKADPLYL